MAIALPPNLTHNKHAKQHTNSTASRHLQAKQTNKRKKERKKERKKQRKRTEKHTHEAKNKTKQCKMTYERVIYIIYVKINVNIHHYYCCCCSINLIEYFHQIVIVRNIWKFPQLSKKSFYFVCLFVCLFSKFSKFFLCFCVWRTLNSFYKQIKKPSKTETKQNQKKKKNKKQMCNRLLNFSCIIKFINIMCCFNCFSNMWMFNSL